MRRNQTLVGPGRKPQTALGNGLATKPLHETTHVNALIYIIVNEIAAHDGAGNVTFI
jgi:hypothetical protein